MTDNPVKVAERAAPGRSARLKQGGTTEIISVPFGTGIFLFLYASRKIRPNALRGWRKDGDQDEATD